ncbi:MAG: methyltransferase domain-containing protein [Candidatus Kapaibacteriales bacterium]
MYPFDSLLVSPTTKNPLYFNKLSNTLVSDEGTFEIVDGIPILLPSNSNHKYIEHYRLDAIYFDYFEPKFPETEAEENRLRQFILKKVPANAKLIADIGCGNGRLTKELLNLNRFVVSVDVSFENLKKVVASYGQENHYPVVADALNLPFRNSAFDCIIASEVIEHIPEPKGLLKELFRVTKKGGVVIITTPYREKIRYSLCIHCNLPTPMNAHLHSFDETKIKAIISETIPQAQFKFFRFGNKLIRYFRLYRLLSILPFFEWRWLDSLLNFMFPKPLHFMIVIQKK